MPRLGVQSTDMRQFISSFCAPCASAGGGRSAAPGPPNVYKIYMEVRTLPYGGNGVGAL